MVYEEWIKSIHQEDGIPEVKEKQMRYEIVSFMTYYGIFFKLPQITIAKGIVIFHQVSMQVSFRKLERFLFGAVCVFLASKLDDHPKPLREFAKAYDYLHTVHKKQTIKNTGNPYFEPNYSEVTEEGYKSHHIDSKKMTELEEKFASTDLEVLKMIGFDLVIELPYHYLDKIKKDPIIPSADFLKIANNFINDSMRTLACLYYEPRVIALAAVNLASHFCKTKLQNVENSGKMWYHCFGDDVAIELVEEVTLYIMEIYKRFAFLKQ